MIPKRFILKKEFDINSYSKEFIFSNYNPLKEESTKKVKLLVDSDKKNCEAIMTTIRSKDLIITLFESPKSDILGTNSYITSSLVSSSAPKLSKTIYIDSKTFMFVYFNDEVVESIIEELQRVSLFIIGNKLGGSGDIKYWKSLLKTYSESNIRYFNNKPATDGESYIYITNKNLFGNPEDLEE